MKKRLLLIGTGGTIASVPTENGYVPGLSGEQLLSAIPKAVALCEIECIQPLSLDSTNMRPEHWVRIAKIIQDRYYDFDGFVILHGTDTMAYTAAGLSYLLQNSPKPIVLTGAQIPAGQPGSDAQRNLSDAIAYACDERSNGVQIVFFGSVILGTRARKNYSKSFSAFGSINYPEIAHIQDGRIIRYINEPLIGDAKFYDKLDRNVGLLKFVPGMRNDVLEYLVDSYDGLIVESFGVGGLPEYADFYGQIKRAVGLGKLVIMATQVPNEGSDLEVYRVGNIVKNELNILEAYDMTTESAFVKTMWILGRTRDLEKAKQLFYQPVYHDILFS